MRVNVVSNTPKFTGTVEYSETLDKCIRNSSDSDLERFEKCLKKIKSVDDGWKYSLEYKSGWANDKSDNYEQKLVLSSNSLGCYSSRTVAKQKGNLLDTFNNEHYKNALKKVVSIIKDDYKKAGTYNKRKDLETRIYDMLG